MHFTNGNSLHPHTKDERTKGTKIEFPSDTQLLTDIDNGMTSEFSKNLSEIKNSDGYKYLLPSIASWINKVKQSPVPPAIGSKKLRTRSEWKILGDFTIMAKNQCPLDSFICVCSIRVSREVRIVYELYAIGSQIKTLFTNCDIHVYRNRLYSDTDNVNNSHYRNIMLMDYD